jgi:hypothetical protein
VKEVGLARFFGNNGECHEDFGWSDLTVGVELRE